MGVRPISEVLFYTVTCPFLIFPGALIALAVWHLFVSKRRGLALHCLIAAWYVQFILDLYSLQNLIYHLVGPFTCGFFSVRDALISYHGTHLVLACVTVPLAVLARGARWNELARAGGYLPLAFLKVTLLIQVSFWWIFTPFGQWPSISYFAQLLE